MKNGREAKSNGQESSMNHKSKKSMKKKKKNRRRMGGALSPEAFASDKTESDHYNPALISYKMECVDKAPSVDRKVKHHIKRAERKKRRLEKALAIRSELEKEKQKKEEQQMLDEEGAAIAEAFALQVLLGEDSGKSCKIMIDKNEEFNPLDRCASNFDISLNGGANAILPHHHSLSKSPNGYKMECVDKAPLGVRKVKKKRMKDRMTQAERKKRRLEKALATSAAIRSELEKKKQKKQEEQQRLNEEAAIAEAFALRVLLGEDSDKSCKIMIGQE